MAHMLLALLDLETLLAEIEKAEIDPEAARAETVAVAGPQAVHNHVASGPTAGGGEAGVSVAALGVSDNPTVVPTPRTSQSSQGLRRYHKRRRNSNTQRPPKKRFLKALKMPALNPRRRLDMLALRRNRSR